MINRRGGIRAMKRGLLAVFLVLTISSASQADPIDVVIEPYPNILAGFITSTYNATTGAFFANGWALTLDTGTAQTTITTPFRLAATIDRDGNATNGNLTIGTATAPLLTGLTLLDFAFVPVQGGALEFLFGDVGGSYIPSIYPNKPLHVALVVGNTFLGNFNNSWNSSSNTAQVRDPEYPTGTPEPATLLLMAAGAVGLYGRFRKRKA
jgi:opacity protein-like surface antigen